ncbi:MAG: AsmA-like C-terminal region-containing protein [Ginsengibacter sp.]
MIYVSINKKSIIKEVTAEFSKKINGNIAVGDVDISLFGSFPAMSVLLKNVMVTDSMYANHHHALFKAEQVFAKLSIAKLIKKDFAINGIKIINGGVYLYTDSTGYSNTYLFNSKKNNQTGKDTSNKPLDLKSIVLKNVELIIDDRKREKLYDIVVNDLKTKLNQKDSLLMFDNDADFLIKNLAFNLPNGSFARGKTFSGNFDLKFNLPLQQLIADNIDVKIAGQPFNINAKFELAASAADPQFYLKVITKQIQYSLVKEILTDKISRALSIADIDKKIDADVILEGPLKHGDPTIVARWNVDNAQLNTRFLNFSKATFSGYYTNDVEKGLPKKDPNSEIVINDFSGEWNGLPVTSKNIQIQNLFTPLLTADLKSDFPMSTLNDLLESNVMELKSGTVHANLTYKGPIIKNSNSNSFLNGEINLNDGTILYIPRNTEMKSVNGKILFQNSNVKIENLQTTFAGSKITMNGNANNLLSLVNTTPDKINIQWNVYSPSLNLGSFMYLLSPPQAKKIKKKKGSLGNLAKMIDEIFYRGSVNVKVNTGQLIYKKFLASNVVADMSILPQKYVINNVQLGFGNGKVSMNGSLTNSKTNYHQAAINTNITNVDVKKLFTAFENFGQSGITAQNLQGNFSAKVIAGFGLNNDGKLLPKSTTSTVDFSLKNGALTNYEPLMKIQDVIFKNRNLQNITFAEIKNNLQISNNNVTIPRMEIASSAFNFFVEGVYGMSGGTDLSLQIPLSNLKRRPEGFKAEKTGTNEKTGSSLFLRGQTGSDGTVQFSTDIFKKFEKDKRRKKNAKS